MTCYEFGRVFWKIETQSDRRSSTPNARSLKKFSGFSVLALALLSTALDCCRRFALHSLASISTSVYESPDRSSTPCCLRFALSINSDSFTHCVNRSSSLPAVEGTRPRLKLRSKGFPFTDFSSTTSLTPSRQPFDRLLSLPSSLIACPLRFLLFLVTKTTPSTSTSTLRSFFHHPFSPTPYPGLPRARTHTRHSPLHLAH